MKYNFLWKELGQVQQNVIILQFNIFRASNTELQNLVNSAENALETAQSSKFCLKKKKIFLVKKDLKFKCTLKLY